MADTKTTNLAAFTPVLTDLLYGVDDPGGVPISGKLTLTSVYTLFKTSYDLVYATAAQGTLADSALQNVVEDTTPELGGDLAAGGNNITNLGDITFKTGAAGGTLRTGTSAADKFQLQAYDVDGGVYRLLIEADAGNDVALQLIADYLRVEDATDTTKQLRFTLDGMTTGVTSIFDMNHTVARTITWGDESGTIQMRPTEGAFVAGDKTKLDGIEALADVTDATNVTAAGALMESACASPATLKLIDAADLTKLDGIEALADVTDATNVAAAGALMAATADQTITGGARITTNDLGNLSGNTITPDPGDRPIQKITNNGAGTIAPGTNQGNYLLVVKNTTGAGAITTSGWALVSGDAFGTSTTAEYLCHCVVVGDFSSMVILEVTA